MVNDGFYQTLYYFLRSFSATTTTSNNNNNNSNNNNNNKDYNAKKVLGEVQQRLWDQLLVVVEEQPPSVTTNQPFSFDSSTLHENSASWSDSGKGLSHVETREDSIVTQMTIEDFNGPESPPKQPQPQSQPPTPVQSVVPVITKKKSKRFPFFKSSSSSNKPVTSPSSSSFKKLHRLRTPTSILKKPMPLVEAPSLTPTTIPTPEDPMRVWLERMSHLIHHQLEPICTSILQKLLTSIPQKLFASSQHNLANVTTDMRQSLTTMQQQLQQQQQQQQLSNKNNTILNPFDPLEILRIIPEDSYILPSAHTRRPSS